MHDAGNTSPHENVLAALRGCGFLAGYHLTVYCRNNVAESPDAQRVEPCCPSIGTSLCGAVCTSYLATVMDQASDSVRPTVFRCPVGLLGFALELRRDADFSYVLIGSGVREKSLDLYRIETVSRSEGINPFLLLEQLQELPIVSEHQVKELADRVYAMAISMVGAAATVQPVRENFERLKVITAISANLDQAESAHEVFTLLQETIGILFDVPAIAAALREHDSRRLKLLQAWGQPVAGSVIKSDQLSRAFPPDKDCLKAIVADDALKALLPETTAACATCHSLVADRELLGILFFFDMEFSEDDYLYIELLVGRAVLRLERLLRDEEAVRKHQLSSRLLSMISTLALSEGQELYDLILKMATELADASCGSLMILDEEQQLLHIKSAIGMNMQLMKVMSIKLGSGIAGKVAASGHPLLVNDIEKDERVATTNRPRFKTKSFISLPLVLRGRVSGVLNLSDKRNNSIFTETDLQVLSPFVSHVSSMMQRSSNQEKVEMLERLSITDPLTELYNRRFLERRMEEEINRSMRNGQHLTVMLIDLDYFKTYNDICGHVAGDKALRKAAKVLRASVRDIDVVTRYGGEEFCVLLPGTSKRESIFVAERIRRDIENELFHGEEHLPFGRLTTSIGISSYPEDGAGSTAVINAADIALYQAKSGGRNRIVIFNSTSHAETGESSPKITLLKK